MADSLFNVKPQDGPWTSEVMADMVADTPHFRYLMAQSARHEAIQALEKAKNHAELNSNHVHAWVAIANGWTNLANATEMNLDPIDYQRRSEPQDAPRGYND